MPAGSVAALSAVVTAALCFAGPRVIGRLPEPVVEADTVAGDTVSYVTIAARPRLGSELALAGGLVGALVGWRLGWEPILACWTYLGAVGVVLAYVDARTRLLPTRLIAPSYAIVVTLLCLAAALDGGVHPLVRAALGWLAMGGFYFFLWFAYPPGLGYGDVRLSGLLGMALAYVGWSALLTGIYAGFLLGGAGGLVLAARQVAGRRHFAFGPYMLLGALVGLTCGETLGAWYMSR